MVHNAIANFKKGFSIIEFLISIVILTIVGIALSNMVVLYIHQRVKSTIANHAPDAAEVLVNYPDKVKNCVGKDPCNGFGGSCTSSIYCSSDNVCTSSSDCIVCYTNPDSGKKIYYSFGASKIGSYNGTYKVTLCWKYADYNDTYTTVITVNP